MRRWHYIQTTSSSHLRVKIIKHVNKIMMFREKNQDGKYVLVGEYRKLPAFVEYHIFALVNVLEGI